MISNTPNVQKNNMASGAFSRRIRANPVMVNLNKGQTTQSEEGLRGNNSGVNKMKGATIKFGTDRA